MNSLYFALPLLICTFLGSNDAVNYCASYLCNPGVINTGCNNTGAFGADCPVGRKMVNMTLALRRAIVQSHNSKRNTLAAGKLPRFPSASRMATMRWNSELAKMASFEVKRCIFEHDACRNTPTFRKSGQNLGESWWDSGNPTDSSIILPLINGFWQENKNTLLSDINSYPASPTRVIGHFTVMANERNIALGCAAITYRDSANHNSYSLTVACNYATTNIVGRSVYTLGPTASGCTTGNNPKFPALCSLAEEYDYNYVNH